MTLQIKKATKSESKLRMALVGASGSGKTYTALAIAEHLGQKILFVDTEHGSASKYADIFSFDVIELDDFAPENFVSAIKLAESNNYDVVILDSLSHEWNGKGGILELHEAEEKRTRNKFTAWASVTPRHNALIEAIVQSKINVIGTMRAKTDYSMTKDERGKTTVENVGLAPIQRDGMEYEFDVVAHLDAGNNFIVKKSRCPILSEKVFNKAGFQVAEILKIWLMGVPKTTIKMPEQKLEIVKPSPVEQSKADYSAEWDQSLEKSAVVSVQTKGKLLAEAGNVSRTAKGYTVTDRIDGENLIFDVVKVDGIIQCDCIEFADGVSDDANYICAHIEAVRFYVMAQQKQAA